MSREPLKRARTRSDSVAVDRGAQERRQTENREYTDQERVDMLRRSLFQAHLPDLPKIPGYHLCWLTTTNPRDPVHGRLRLGYELLKATDVPEFESLGMKTGEYAGCIAVNEMIAAKLPSHLYEAYMREVHHDAPMRETEAIYNSALQASEEAAQAAKRGGKIKEPLVEAGTEELGQAREPPIFSDEMEA
jgi:hypothetical protein